MGRGKDGFPTHGPPSIAASAATLNNALATSPLIPKLNHAINNIKHSKDGDEPDLFIRGFGGPHSTGKKPVAA
jgi:hypothetical protein